MMALPPSIHSDPPGTAVSRHHEGRGARRLQHRARHHSRGTTEWRLLQGRRVSYQTQALCVALMLLKMAWTYCPLQRVQAGREGEREDREDGDRGRRWDATLAAIREVP